MQTARLRDAVRARLSRRRPSEGLHPSKLEVIDFAFEALGARTFADLGGIWHVDGGYSFYALERHGADRGTLVDWNVSEAARRRVNGKPLRIIEGSFSHPETVAAVGPVDVAFHFDTLLHQLRPDWDDVVELYAALSRIAAIVQPQWLGNRTIRLLDELGPDGYLETVTPPGKSYDVETFRAELDTPLARRGRAWRDTDAIWQWGITDNDLVNRMHELGYRLDFFKNWGSFLGLQQFERHAFVFVRRD